MGGVGEGDIDLVAVDARSPGPGRGRGAGGPGAGLGLDELDDAGVISLGEARDVDDDRAAPGLELGQLAAQEGLDAGIGKAYGIEHARGRLDDARGEVALAGLEGDGLRIQRAEGVDAYEPIVLGAVADGARREPDGISQDEAADPYPEVGLHRSAPHSMAEASNTGPSAQALR